MRASSPCRSQVARLRVVGAVLRVGARGAEDGAAAREDARHGVAREWLYVILDEATPAVRHAEDFGPLDVHRAAHDGADDRVQPRRVAAPRQNTNT